MQRPPVGPTVRVSRFAASRFALAALGLLTLATALPAATINVNSFGDTITGMNTTSVALFNAGGTRSLRGAILAVNNDSTGPHTINLPAGTYTLTIANATATTEENLAATGDLDIRKPVTIAGAGSAGTFVVAGTSTTNGIDKIISVNPAGGLPGFAVAISGVTLRYGRNQIVALYPGNNAGGAMDFDAGSTATGALTLSDVVIDQSSTTNGDGGALALFNGGNVTANNCSFTTNTAGSTTSFGGDGGAVFVGYSTNAGSAVFTNCNFSGNRTATTGAAAGHGGGLFSFRDGSATQLALHNCTVANNLAGAGAPVGASLDGGGIFAGALTLDQGSVVSGNTATRRGGGVYVASSASTIANSTVVSNTAGAGTGGGVFDNRGVTTISGSRVALNTATGGAAALATNLGNTGANAAAIVAPNNWLGSNAPASLVDSGVNATPWLVLAVTATPATVVAGQTTASVVAGITTNSTAGTGFTVPGAVPVTFSAVLGTMNPTSSTLSVGVRSSVFTPGAVAGAGSAAATVDGQTVSAAIAVITPFRAWQVANFAANADTPTIAGEAADPDGDGLANLLEYALGLNPNVTSTTNVVVDTVTGALRLTAPKVATATDITYLVEVSGDLVTWTTAGTTVDINTATQLRVRDNTPISGAARRFIRLKITHP